MISHKHVLVMQFAILVISIIFGGTLYESIPVKKYCNKDLDFQVEDQWQRCVFCLSSQEKISIQLVHKVLDEPIIRVLEQLQQTEYNCPLISQVSCFEHFPLISQTKTKKNLMQSLNLSQTIFSVEFRSCDSTNCYEYSRFDQQDADYVILTKALSGVEVSLYKVSNSKFLKDMVFSLLILCLFGLTLNYIRLNRGLSFLQQIRLNRINITAIFFLQIPILFSNAIEEYDLIYLLNRGLEDIGYSALVILLNDKLIFALQGTKANNKTLLKQMTGFYLCLFQEKCFAFQSVYQNQYDRSLENMQHSQNIAFFAQISIGSVIQYRLVKIMYLKKSREYTGEQHTQDNGSFEHHQIMSVWNLSYLLNLIYINFFEYSIDTLMFDSFQILSVLTFILIQHVVDTNYSQELSIIVTFDKSQEMKEIKLFSPVVTAVTEQEELEAEDYFSNHTKPDQE